VLPLVTQSHSVFLSPDAVWFKPELWFTTVHKLRVSLAVTNNAALQLCVDELAGSDFKVSLEKLERCLVLSPERPHYALLQAFATAFSHMGLKPDVVTFVGHLLNGGFVLFFMS
jgi:hypothetical protein